MKKFNEVSTSSDELYEWCIKEYTSANPISKLLINNFYKELNTKIIQPVLPGIKNIIEIGCGAAESTQRILKMVDNVNYEATEYDKRYIEAIKKRDLTFKVTQEDVYNLQKSDNSYDCVIMLEVLEHLEHIELALKELFRVSSKYVIISVPNEPFWRLLNLIRLKYIKDLGNTPGHINHWGRNQLRRLMANYGKIVGMAAPLPWIIIIAEKE